MTKRIVAFILTIALIFSNTSYAIAQEIAPVLSVSDNEVVEETESSTMSDNEVKEEAISVETEATDDASVSVSQLDIFQETQVSENTMVPYAVTLNAPEGLFVREVREDYIVLRWDMSKNSSLASYNIYRSENADTDFLLLDNCLPADDEEDYIDYNEYEDETIETGKTYYYKVTAVSVDGTESTYSATVTNNGMMEGISDGNVIGAQLTDDKGNVIKALTLHEGESITLNVSYLTKSGTALPDKSETSDESCIWNKRKDGNTFEEKEPYEIISVDLNDEYKVAVKGTAISDVNSTYTVEYRVYSYDTPGFHYDVEVPITVIEAEWGTEYDDPEMESKIYEERDALNQAIRAAFVGRAQEICVYVPRDTWEEWMDAEGNPYKGWPSYTEVEWLEYMNWGWSIDKDVMDFFSDRESLKPYEGDYLWHGVLSYLGEENEVVGADGKFYYQLKYYDIKYQTSKSQEEWVDNKVNEIVHQKGGALYPYRDASEVEKVRAIRQYIVNNVSYVGTTTPVYHSC